jgi:hypothetical protein
MDMKKDDSVWPNDRFAPAAIPSGEQPLARFFTNPTEVRETALRFSPRRTAFNQLTANAAAPVLPPTSHNK